MIRKLISILLCGLLTASSVARAGDQETLPDRQREVDLLLVLAVDVSRSIEEDEFKLQREGYAAAITDVRVLQRIKSGLHGKIAVAYTEWSHPYTQHVIVDWTIIDGPETAQRFRDILLTTPRLGDGRTSISGAIEHAVRMLRNAPYTAYRLKIDVSGDGPNNEGIDIRSTRDRALQEGIVINGLVIVNKEATFEPYVPAGGLKEYYKKNVIGGPGSFVMEVEGYESFREAIVKKLVLEIAAR